MITRIAAAFLCSECRRFDLHSDEMPILPSHKVNTILLSHRHLPALLFKNDRRCYVFTDQASLC